jgi:hypothetical protein
MRDLEKQGTETDPGMQEMLDEAINSIVEKPARIGGR